MKQPPSYEEFLDSLLTSLARFKEKESNFSRDVLFFSYGVSLPGKHYSVIFPEETFGTTLIDIVYDAFAKKGPVQGIRNTSSVYNRNHAPSIMSMMLKGKTLHLTPHDLPYQEEQKLREEQAIGFMRTTNPDSIEDNSVFLFHYELANFSYYVAFDKESVRLMKDSDKEFVIQPINERIGVLDSVTLIQGDTVFYEHFFRDKK